MSNRFISAAELKKELENLAGMYNVPSIVVWKQGHFIDSPRYRSTNPVQKKVWQENEERTIRPYGGTNNALFQVQHNEDDANIAEYLQQVGELLERFIES